MSERKIQRRRTPHGWVEWLEPDWEHWREHLRQPVDAAANVRAGLRYTLNAFRLERRFRMSVDAGRVALSPCAEERIMSRVWEDTTGHTHPPADNVWKQARWLVGRHPRMQHLCERVGAVDDDEEGRWPHVDMLADIIRASDTYGRAWERYEHEHSPPQDDTQYDAWREAGPKPEDSAAEFNLATAHGIRAFLPMSGGEKRLLRILATIGTHRVEFCSSDLDGLDDEGHAFIQDWLAIIVR